MANFQNVGTTNAGTFTVNNAGAALPGGTPTMDAAAIQSGNAFLSSELEKRDPLIRKPLTSVTHSGVSSPQRLRAHGQRESIPNRPPAVNGASVVFCCAHMANHTFCINFNAFFTCI